ncbi:MAG: SurA N-terminal domain-containing protein [Pseudomonadota bacterium]
MLEFIRRGVKSIFAKILLGVLVLSFAVWGIGDIFSFSGNTSVATVGEQEVTAEQFADAISRNQAQVSQQAGRLVTLAEMRDQGFGFRILGRLMRDAALAAEAEMLGIRAPDRAVADAILDMEAFQGPNGEFSTLAYRQFLGQQNFTVPEFEALRRHLMESQLILGTVAGSALPPPGVAPRIAAHDGEQRTVSTLTLTYDMAAAPGVPTNEQLSEFLAENEARFREPERKFGQYLAIDINALTEASQPEEAAIREAYDANADAFISPAEATVEQINFASLEEAETAAASAGDAAGFAALAVERGLAQPDIALGTVAPDDLPPAASEAVFALDGPAVVGPIETPLGAALLNVLDVAPERQTPFEDVRDDIAEQLALETAFATAPELAGQVDEFRAEGRPFDEIAEAIDGVEAGPIDGWAANGSVADGSAAPAILAAQPVRTELLTALDLEERDLVELDDGSYVLIQIERIEPSFLPELDDIRGRVGEAWITERRLADLEAQGERIVTALSRGTGATLGSMAAGMGRAVTELGPFLRSGQIDGIAPADISRIFALDEGGAFVTRALGEDSIVVVALDAVTTPDAERLASATEELEGAFRTSLGRDIAEYFSRAAETSHGVSVDDTAVSEVFEFLGASQSGRPYGGHGG